MENQETGRAEFARLFDAMAEVARRAVSIGFLRRQGIRIAQCDHDPLVVIVVAVGGTGCGQDVIAAEAFQ